MMSLILLLGSRLCKGICPSTIYVRFLIPMMYLHLNVKPMDFVNIHEPLKETLILGCGDK